MQLVGYKQDLNARSLSFFSETKVSLASPELISELEQISVTNEGANIRLCFHSSPDESFHDMLILENRNARYYRPHCHLNKPETLHIVQGKANVFIFNEKGGVEQHHHLSFEGCPIIRIGEGMFHTVIPATETVIYHEAKPGPFIPDSDAVFPGWAPDGIDSDESKQYIDNLLMTSKKK